jgi:hypothetical protein
MLNQHKSILAHARPKLNIYREKRAAQALKP